MVQAATSINEATLSFVPKLVVLGIILALARQSNMPVVKMLAVMFIELIRGVPLITLLFVASIGVHMLRVFFTGAFRKPRELNWVIGCVLSLLALVEGFAGYSLPDDLLSGTGLRAAQGFMVAAPVIGSYLSYGLFGGTFPGEDIIPRLYSVHILLLPALLIALFTVHIVLVALQKHTQYPGPGKTNDNVVGFPVMPVYAAKAGGFFFIVFGILAQAVFGARFIIQWLASERAMSSGVPAATTSPPPSPPSGPMSTSQSADRTRSRSCSTSSTPASASALPPTCSSHSGVGGSSTAPDCWAEVSPTAPDCSTSSRTRPSCTAVSPCRPARRPTTTSTCAGSPSTARPPRSSAGSCVTSSPTSRPTPSGA